MDQRKYGGLCLTLMWMPTRRQLNCRPFPQMSDLSPTVRLKRNYLSQKYYPQTPKKLAKTLQTRKSITRKILAKNSQNPQKYYPQTRRKRKSITCNVKL
jgi:hypothetical protein